MSEDAVTKAFGAESEARFVETLRRELDLMQVDTNSPAHRLATLEDLLKLMIGNIEKITQRVLELEESLANLEREVYGAE